jgi:hypothetical protein
MIIRHILTITLRPVLLSVVLVAIAWLVCLKILSAIVGLIAQPALPGVPVRVPITPRRPE